jgi:hypothetical protein
MMLCLDGRRISARILSFRLVVDNSVRLMISQKNEKIANFYYFGLVKYYLDANLRTMKKIAKIISHFLLFYLIKIFT